MKFIVSLINTCFFIGNSPFAPGTLGSLFALIVWWIFYPFGIFNLLPLFLIAIFSYWTILIELKDSDEKDPQHIVVDEALGMWISLFFICPSNFFNIILAFMIFRLLDIFKPSIINRSQNISGPGGILADDIISGLITCVLFWGISGV